MVGLEARLRMVLADADPAITVTGPLRHLKGYLNDLWFFDSDVGRLVAKLRPVPEEDPEQLRTYVGTMRLLRETGFPTPELMIFDESCAALDGRQFSVLRYAPGTVAAEALGGLSGTARATYFRDLGRTIGRLHEIDLPPTTVWRDDTGRAHAGWLEVVQSSLDEARGELTGLSGEQRRLIDTAAGRIERDAAIILPAVGVPRLVHRDLHPGNLLVEADRVTAVLDFEMVREWDAAYDFVKINNSIVSVHPDSKDPLLAGYREHAPWDDDFESRAHLYQGLYCLLAAADFLDGNDGHRHWPNQLRRWLHRG